MSAPPKKTHRESVAVTLPQRLFMTNDGLGGWIAVAVGLVAIAEGIRLGAGSISRMGPGYVPLAVGLGLCGLGAVLVVKALRKPGAIASIPFGLPVLLVLASLAAFGLILPNFGLFPASAILMLIASWAITGRIGTGDIAYAVIVGALASLVFINGLGMVLPIVRWPF